MDRFGLQNLTEVQRREVISIASWTAGASAARPRFGFWGRWVLGGGSHARGLCREPKRRRRCALPAQSIRRGDGQICTPKPNGGSKARGDLDSVLDCGGKRSATPLWLLG